MKKPKMSLGEGGAKGFFIRHVEKMALAVCVLLVALFFYFGWSTEGLPDSKTPPNLAQAVTQARNVIDQDHSDPIVRDRKPTSNFVSRAQEILQPTSSAKYAIQPINPRVFGSTERRGDPELLPPAEFEFTAVTGPIPVKPLPAFGSDALAALPDAKAPEPKKPRKQERQPTEMMYDEYQQQATGGSRGRGRGRRGSGGSATMSDADMMMMNAGSAEMTPDSYGMGAMGGATGKKNYPGYRPGGGGSGGYDTDAMMMGPGSGAQGGAAGASSLIPKSYSFIVGNMVAPQKEQFTRYEEAFSNAAGYLPQRDRPRYVWVEVQRVDVTGDPEAPIDENAWKHVIDTDFAYKWATIAWAGVPQEVADPRFLNPNITLPAPPLMMRDLDPLLLHSKVPRASVAAKKAAEEAKKARQQAIPSEFAGSDAAAAADTAGSAAGVRGPAAGVRGPAAGVRGPGAAAPSGPGAYSRFGSSGGAGMMGSSGMMGSGYGSEYGSMGMEAYGGEMDYADDYGSMGGSMGMGSMGMGGYGGTAQLAEVVDYQQVRFVDFREVQPGRVYRYRVRLWVEDPNNPEAAQAAPRPQDLTAEALERLRALKAADEAANAKLAKDQPPKRTWWRETPWSEPSPPVTVPLPARQFAGGMDKRNTRPVGDAAIEVAPPTGKLMVVGWDDRYACDVPKEAKVMPGSVLNFAEKVDVLHPISLRWKEIESYDLATNALVLDMRGGNYTFGYKEGDKDAPVMEPAEFAIFDAAGNFRIRNELDDAEKFDLFEPNPPPAASSAMPGMMGGSSGADYEAGYQQMMDSYR